MTWGEWASSNYNTDGYIIDTTNHIANSNGFEVFSRNDGGTLLSTKTILNNEKYVLEPLPY